MIKGLLAHEKLFDKEDLEAIRKVCELFDRGPNLVKGICNMPDKSTGPIGMGVEEIISQTQSQFAFFKADELVKKVSNKYTSLIGATHCTYTKGKSHFPHTDRLGIGGKSVIGAVLITAFGEYEGGRLLVEGEDIHVSDGQVVVMAAPGPYHEVTQIAAGIRHSFVLIYELL